MRKPERRIVRTHEDDLVHICLDMCMATPRPDRWQRRCDAENFNETEAGEAPGASITCVLCVSIEAATPHVKAPY